MSAARREKELLFAIGALQGAGLSEEYARLVAERVLSDVGPLSESDRGYREFIERAQRMFARATYPRWGNAN